MAKKIAPAIQRHQAPRPGKRGMHFENPEEYSRVCQAEYEAGNKLALPRLLAMCAMSDWQIPKWAGEILIGAEYAASFGDLKSWDTIFGKRRPNERRKVMAWAKRWDIYCKVLHYHALGEPIDDPLFEKVGDYYGMGKTKTKEIYAWMRDREARRLAGESIDI
jgi:hypothetical protein